MVPTRVHLADRPHRLRLSEPSICGMFIRDGVLKQNVRHICRLAVTLYECRPAPDNPYYRGLGCADFSEQRRPCGAVGIIGGFSPIALKINDPRREVLLAPAHRPRCISSRTPKFAASMKPKLNSGLSSPHPELSRIQE